MRRPFANGHVRDRPGPAPIDPGYDAGGMSDDLVARARAGDREAFGHLVAPHLDRTRAILQLRLPAQAGKLVDVEDALQETLLLAWRGIAELRDGSPTSVRVWIARIASNVAIDLARRLVGSQKRDLRREVPLAGATSSSGNPLLPAESAPDAVRRLRREERLRRLEAALAALAPDHREVILLARIEGLPMSAVGERMGRTPKAASTLLYRALLALRDRFGETDSFGLPSEPNPVP
jgi:RNA polymerase sigma-70 factor (ECF subfamily)